MMNVNPGQIEVLDEAQAAILRRKSGAERLAIACRMWIAARNMLHSHLRAEHPEWDAAQISREVARRLSHGSV